MLECYGVCDVGLVRQTNQDFILTDEDLGLFLVADGMGGHSHGEVASRLAAETIQSYIATSRDRFDVSWPFGYEFDLSVDGNRLNTAVRLANRQVWRRADQDPKSSGMGTTVAALLANGMEVVVGNVGDSRIYRYRNGTLEQLSEDDTWIRGMLSRGLISEEEARTHPMRNVLVQAAGSHEDVTVHIRQMEVLPGDLFLISSDGLHGVVGDAGICAVLESGGTLEQAASRLAQAARGKGAPDNVSVILVRFV